MKRFAGSAFQLLGCAALFALLMLFVLTALLEARGMLPANADRI